MNVNFKRLKLVYISQLVPTQLVKYQNGQLNEDTGWVIIIIIIIKFGKKNHCMHQGSQRNTISISIIGYGHPTG